MKLFLLEYITRQTNIEFIHTRCRLVIARSAIYFFSIGFRLRRHTEYTNQTVYFFLTFAQTSQSESSENILNVVIGNRAKNK